MATRTELEVYDPLINQTYYIPIAPGEQGGKLFTKQTVDWEPADGSAPWRVGIHPWDAGLGPNRISPAITFSGTLANRPTMVYAKANIDASYANYITAPPLKKNLGSSVVVSFYNQSKDLYYGGARYGGATYVGAASSTSAYTTAVRNFNGKAYFGGGQYLVSVDASYNYTVVRDFGAGKIIYDIEPFNNELIIAMGPSEHQWKMTAAESFAQSSDVFSLALAAVDDLLWGAYTINLVHSCEITPNSLSSYAADYSVGNTTYSITDLGEFGGVLAVFRPDGVFFPDGETIFHNQTPQLRDYPDLSNGRGWWVGWGNLYVPSIAGLLEVNTGASFVKGPELAQRPDFRMRVRAGVEWNGAQYLICTDEANLTNTFVCKMMKDTRGLADTTPYIYHEWNRLDSTDKSYIILVFSVPTNPTMFAGRGGQGLYYWLMGRGSGPDVNDPNYILNTTYELESGDFIPVSDRSIQNTLTGIKITGKQPAGSTLEVQYAYDGSDTYLPMLTTQEGGGTTLITTPGFFSEMRYAPPNTQGNVPRIKIIGTLPANTTGPDRPEIYECWAFGEAHPETTEVITLGIYNDIMARVNGIAQGSRNATDLLTRWAEDGVQLKVKIPGYAEKEQVVVTVDKIEDQNLEYLASGLGQLPSSITKVVFRRIDFQGVLSA